MRTALKYLALIAATIAPFSVLAQSYGPPGYTFGNMFPNMFQGGNGFGMPGGFSGTNQSPFLTMPAPQFPGGNAPQAPAYAANPMAQPTPYWMQTPQSAQPPARFIEQVPSNAAPRGYTVFDPSGYAAQFQQATPPRWAPLFGQSPVIIQAPRTGNNWAFGPSSNTVYAPAAPPKWPTP